MSIVHPGFGAYMEERADARPNDASRRTSRGQIALLAW